VPIEEEEEEEEEEEIFIYTALKNSIRRQNATRFGDLWAF
jgi:hypothetical protein